MTLKSGVYAIQHLPSGRTYIGSSVDMPNRWTTHKCALRGGIHQNAAMQQDWERDGESAFVFIVLERIEDEVTRHFVEQHHIDRTPLHYNLNHRAGSGPAVGRKHRPETIERMRKAHLGKKFSAEHRARIAAAKRGQKHSDATKAMIGKFHLGRKRSEETRAKMRAKRHIQDRTGVGAAISAAKQGKPWSVAQRWAFEQRKAANAKAN